MVDRVKPQFMVHGLVHGSVHGFAHGLVCVTWFRAHGVCCNVLPEDGGLPFFSV